MKDIQSLDILEKSIIRTGKDQLDSTYVNWVSVIETPVESFVRKNELVLTTGVGCAHDPNLFYAFVTDIIHSEASALAIAIGPFVQQIPDSIIVLAKKHNFILLELDWSIRFSDILEKALEYIHETKRRYFDNIEKLRKALLEFILSGKSLDLVAQYVSTTIGHELLIADKRGKIRGKCQTLSDNLQSKWETIIYEQLEQEGIYYDHEHTVNWFEYENGFALQLPIHSSGNIQGYIVVGDFGEEPFDEDEEKQWLLLLEHVTTAVAIHFLHEQAAKEAEWRLRDDFVWELSKGSLHPIEATLSRAKSLGYQLNLPYICLVAKPERVKESFEPMSHVAITFDHWLHECIRLMEEEAESIAKSFALKSMVTYQQEELIIYIEVTHPNTVSQAKTYISKLNKRIYFLFPSLSLTWGIAKQHGYSCFEHGYQEAKRALEIGRKRNGVSSISVFADTTVDRIIESLLKNDEIIDIAHTVLDSLLYYSQEREIDLLHTFMIYHENRGNVSQTARDLNLHRQSLMYRLRKIEALTNCSLDNAEDLFILDLSSRLWVNGMKTKTAE